LIQAGVDDIIVMRLKGHNIKNFIQRVYVHREIEELLEAVNKLNYIDVYYILFFARNNTEVI